MCAFSPKMAYAVPMNDTKLTIAVLGGGAAGMMAAVAATEEGQKSADGTHLRVLLFEKNKYLGAKVLISGGGRCNVTTGIFDVKKLMENYPRGSKFLMSAMYRFPPEKVKEWFETRGVPLKIEEDLRIFPVSNNGKDVVGALENELKRLGVEILTETNATEVHAMQQGSLQKFLIKSKDGREFLCDAVIITTGGNAYRHTGSSGDGYAFAKNLGHTITPLSPSLNSFVVSESWIKKLAGVSFEKVEITLKSHDGKRTYKRKGPVVFTHHGVSGPAVFAVSAMATHEQYDRSKPMEVRMNFFPDETAEALAKRFQAMAGGHGKKTLLNFLDMFLPKSLCEVMLEVLKADSGLHTGRLPKTVREALLKDMQGLTMSVVGRGAGDEFVTAGGVTLEEVNTNTMESKKCPSLYFAGEILDIDGFTGGFNLQASWATGKLAGENAAKRLLKS